VGRASRLKKEKRNLLELLSEAQQAPPTQKDRSGIWHRIPLFGKAAIGVAVTLFGLWTGYLTTIKPRILIVPPSKLVDPQNPYDAPFTLTNDGYLSVYRITVDCEPALVAVNGVKPASKAFPWNLKAVGTPRIRSLDVLSPDDPKPFVCDAFRNLRPTNVTIVGVEVQVTVTVSPFSSIYWPFPKSILFEADSDGTDKFQWHELAIGEEPHFPQAAMWMNLSKGRFEGTVRR